MNKELAKPTQNKIVLKKIPDPSKNKKSNAQTDTDRHENKWKMIRKIQSDSGFQTKRTRTPAANMSWVILPHLPTAGWFTTHSTNCCRPKTNPLGMYGRLFHFIRISSFVPITAFLNSPTMLWLRLKPFRNGLTWVFATTNCMHTTLQAG